MEEDIKRLEYILEFPKKLGIQYVLETQDEKALQHLISAYKKLKEENKELKEKNRHLQISNSQLKADNEINCIRKSKIENKIEEIKNNCKECNIFELIDCTKHCNFYYGVQVLQELLERNK